MPLNFDDPTRAAVRVVLANSYDPTDNLDALMNPESLNINISMNIGKMSPVGSSHDVKQYASTMSPSFPLEFYFSAEIAARTNYKYPDITRALNWFTACGYGREAGRAPDPLIVLWPSVLSMQYAVETIDVTYMSFSRTLRTKTARVVLTGGELRTTFQTRDRQLEDGFEVPMFRNISIAGAPLNMGNSRGSKG